MSDSENTFRALKGEPLFVDRWQCRVGLHRWGRWSEPQRKNADLHFRQHSMCVDCGRAKVVKVDVPR